MSYPSLEQYNNAFQRHATLLADAELKGGTLSTTSFGLPLAISGGFALTYTITAGPKKYAVRCFHRKSNELERRYQSISKRLATLKSPYFLDFQFQPQGIRVDGGIYPIVKMAWAKGETLGEFLEDNCSNAAALGKLSDALAAMAAMLEKERIAHGDLQTGNLMVSGGGSLVQLIDYDGMYVDEIKDLGSAEAGHLNFQHPQRKSANPFEPTLDRFSLISLYLALKALRTDPSLWRKTNSEVDAILFRANDFAAPSSSPVFALLAANGALAADAKNFAAVCMASIAQAPSLADFIAGQSIPQTISAISFNGAAAANAPKLGYVGAYDVLSASDFALCLKHVGDKVEVIGKIVEVNLAKTQRSHKPYIFINFGNWRGRIFKVAIWPQAMAILKNQPDKSWEGKWLTITGLMEPPYSNAKFGYTHLSISISANGQMTLISEVEAQRRLASPGIGSRTAIASNQDALARIKQQATPTRTAPTPRPSAPAPRPAALPLSSNEAILAKIRATAPPVPAVPHPTARRAPSVPSTGQPPYTHRPPMPSSFGSHQQPEGFLSKLFKFIFK